MGKCLCIYRTSTDVQEVESQKQDVISMAIADGYTEEEIITIGCAGASAIKLNKKYMAQMESIYNTLDSEEIECVYAWDVDRIGRNEEILMQFKNRLIKKKIQLKIKSFSVPLFNSKNKVDYGFELVYSFFATRAKQEMEQKMERFERGKTRNMLNMRWNGGQLPIGYKKDENGFIQINEEEEPFVKMIFSLFNTGKYSTNTLAREVNSRGYRSKLGNEFNNITIGKILKNKSYTGSYFDKKGREHRFPAIISNEEFEKAKSILASNNKRQSKSTKHYYFAIKLLKCESCGFNYVSTRTTYVCGGKLFGTKEGYKHLCHCEKGYNILLNTLDGILWTLTKRFAIEEIESDSSQIENETKEEIKVVQQKIESLESKLSLYDKKIDEIVERADRELRSEAYISKRIATVNQQRETEQKQLVKLKEELARLEYNLQFSTSFQKWLTGYNSISEVELAGDEKTMRDLVHRYIKNITLDRTEYRGSKSYYKIDITTHKGLFTVYYFFKNGLIHKTYIKEPDLDGEFQFKFEKLIRNGNHITTESNERFKKFKKIVEDILIETKDMQAVWDVIMPENGETELSKFYETILDDNNQRATHYFNQLALDLKNDHIMYIRTARGAENIDGLGSTYDLIKAGIEVGRILKEDDDEE